MSDDPFAIPPQSVVSFSGGRTSGYMLRRILDAFGGALPPDRHVVFANTGRERSETLDFVAECGSRWGVPIVWLEYDRSADHRTALVNHNSAARHGEPFDQIISDRKILPNPTMRFCTIDGKIRRIESYAKHWLDYDPWHNIVGLRADEQGRVDKLRQRKALGKDGKNAGVPLTPLADAGVTKRDVAAFWRSQTFDLRLPLVNGSTPEGNCDLCFLKTEANLAGTIRRQPHLAAWWIAKEQAHGHRGSHGYFRQGRSPYAALLEAGQRQGDFADIFSDMGGESVDCACTD